MKTSLSKFLLSGVFTLVLLALGSNAYSQCAPKVIDRNNVAVEKAVYCVNELVPFRGNSPGFQTNVTWDFKDGFTSNVVDIDHAFFNAGVYNVTFTGTGPGGTCNKTFEITIKPVPTIVIKYKTDSMQCFENNSFCFRDSSYTNDTSRIVRQTYLFSNGARIDSISPTFPYTFCYSFPLENKDGGWFDLLIESETSNGCVTRRKLDDYLFITPKLGIEFLNRTPKPNPGCDSTLGRYENVTKFPLNLVERFCWYWGDGDSICGDTTTNSDWWYGPNGDGIVEHMYYENKTFDGKLKVKSVFGCTETFTFKAAVTNIVINPVIIADKDSSCVADNPVNFSLSEDPPAGASAWLWNFGDPPSGLLNFNDKEWEVSHNYGTGPWNISLNIIAGPCNVTIYDTITKMGPGSTIEVPGGRVLEKETYQCVITDSVHFPNNSSFYHNDPNPSDEDSTIFWYSWAAKIVYDATVNADSILISRYKYGKIEWKEKYAPGDTVDVGSFEAYFDFNLNKLVSIERGDTQYITPPDSIKIYGMRVAYDPIKDSLILTRYNDTSYFSSKDTLHPYLFQVLFNSSEDSIYYVSGTNSTPFPHASGFVSGLQKRFAFNPADQTALLDLPGRMLASRSLNPHVWRVWDFGDQYAPQCTTDTRPWRNKNIGINCNWSIDSLPVHWYTPWDYIYKVQNNGNFYRTPVTKTFFNKTVRKCYTVDVYRADSTFIPGDTILTVPYGKSLNYRGNIIGVLTEYPSGYIGNYRIRRPPAYFVAPYIYLTEDSSTFVVIQGSDTQKFDRNGIGLDTIMGSLTWTVTEFDMEFMIPSGVTIVMSKLQAAGGGGGGGGVGTVKTVTGPKTIIIEKDWQWTILENDTIYPQLTIEENKGTWYYAQPSTYWVDSSMYNYDSTYLRDTSLYDDMGNFIKDSALYAIDSTFIGDTTFQRTGIYVDAALHREDFFTERAQCFQVELWHQDTVHPFLCEAVSNKSLALIPPNAKKMKITPGSKPCPADGNNLAYYFVFEMDETKPGCTQQWFAVNFDTLSDPNNYIPFNSGGILAPPPPGNPLPFLLPYQTVGNYGTKFTKAYSAGEIGNDPARRKPNGSFTVSLIVGNGQPNPNGGAPACVDTAYYFDMFRILYLNADFDIVSPTQPVQKAICAGGDAYFRINVPVQDSIKTLRWNWGYQGHGRGVNLATYFEDFHYYEPYTGPVQGRNDEDFPYDPNNDDFLYNYIVRFNLSDVTGVERIDTIVTAIIHEWRIVADKDGSEELVKDSFEARGLDYNSIPQEDISLYLGDGTFACIDTTGFSDKFVFGIKPYSENVDSLVYREGKYRYRYTDETRSESVLVATILHFRDSSLIGYDSLLLDTNNDGKKDTLRGLWKHTYKHPKIVVDPCTGQSDTIYVPSNGPMLVGLSLNNTVGCLKRAAQYLNVGFLNDFWLEEQNVCQGNVVSVYDSLRYWQYTDQRWPLDYPLDPRDLWNTPERYLNGLEIYEADWDKDDNVWDFERSLELSHVYDSIGIYNITIHTKDSIGCHDTVELKAYVTDVIPHIGFSTGFLNCNWIVDFKDSSEVLDPCRTEGGCETNVACDSVIAWEWDFGDGTRTSNLRNPSHDFTQGGWFDITLTVKTLLGCEDSVTRSIFIPGPDPEFKFALAEWDRRDSAVICVDDSVALRNISNNVKVGSSWEMKWGDGKVSNPEANDSIYSHTYNTPGTYYLYFIQYDTLPGTNIRCNRIFPDTNPDLTSLRKIKVVVLPRRPSQLEISDTLLCPDELANFTAHVDSAYSEYIWYYGDGDTTAADKPDSVQSHSYSSPGRYLARLIPLYKTAPFIPVCPTVDSTYVTVVDVFASFSVDSTDKPNFCFINESTGAVNYDWTFEDQPAPGTSTEVDPCYNWSDRVGEWEVCLTAYSPEGCEDDTCITIYNSFQRLLIPYNVFTPTKTGEPGDGINDLFVIDGKGLEEYNIKIYNRWGEKVFESDDIDYSWNGRVNNDGVLCPEGTYFYIINYKFLFENENEGKGPIEGQVELIREQ